MVAAELHRSYLWHWGQILKTKYFTGGWWIFTMGIVRIFSRVVCYFSLSFSFSLFYQFAGCNLFDFTMQYFLRTFSNCIRLLHRQCFISYELVVLSNIFGDYKLPVRYLVLSFKHYRIVSEVQMTTLITTLR